MASNSQQLAIELGKQGYALWESGRLDGAAGKYRLAIAASEPNHAGAAHFHGVLATILKQLGRGAEATPHYERALALELAHGGSDGDLSVKTARYFFAEHLQSQGDSERALEILVPSLERLPHDWLLACAQAMTLFSLKRFSEARLAAERAIAHANSPIKAEELRAYLQPILVSTTD